MRTLFVTMLVCSAVVDAAPMQWPELLERPKPQATRRIAYGSDPLQFAELWLPDGKGPHPVVVMVHGGCWQTDVAERDIMNYLAEDLRSSGVAVWNLEYRGVDRPGGGYPGTFLDVAAGADALKEAAAANHLKLDRVPAIGHSAGGHLALWLAARSRIKADSPLHASSPLPLSTVVAIGAIPDLQAAQTPPGTVCEIPPIHSLTGPPTKTHADVYADTSPTRLLPFNAKQVLVNATLDRVAPPAFASSYADQARRAGVAVKLVTIPNEGHVELIAPGTASWKAERAALFEALGLKP